MTISVRVEFSHPKSFNTEVKGYFKMLLVPEKVAVARNVHYIILLDTSGSMKGMKIELAKKSTREILNKIPQGNYVTLITFSGQGGVKVLSEHVDISSIDKNVVDNIIAEGTTPFYSTLSKAFEIVKKYNEPAYMLALTDGMPTDIIEVKAYEQLDIPPNTKIYAFGIGDDYKEEILKILADKSGGIFYHLQDPTEIEQKLPSSVATEIGAKNVVVDIISEAGTPVKLLNYQGPPVNLGVVEGAVRIYGEVTIPPNYSSDLLTVKVSYVDPVQDRVQEIIKKVGVSKAIDNNDFLSSINKDVTLEYRYYELLAKYASDIQAQNLVEATRTLNQLTQISQQTRRIEFMETTRRLADALDQTRRVGSSVEQTRKLSKEVTSEVTRKLRGS
ncbi:MAG: VWA domain-containing protein [Sulfolobaceae archaeon]|nr:VWA domain-containing protein [Sulfolobaceae archaeon]